MQTADEIQNQSPKQRAEPSVNRIRVRNFRSIGKCDVALQRLTVLIGRNGAGKSNFLDALRFVTDSLETSLDHAIKARGGIDAVRRRSTGHPRNFAVVLDLNLSSWQTATYGFEIAARKGGGFTVKREELRIVSPQGQKRDHYQIVDGNIASASVEHLPVPAPDRLFLVTASGLAPFRPVFDALTAMGFYNLNPDAMKELQSPDAGELLHRDGSNVASVVGRLTDDNPRTIRRIEEYLAAIVPGVAGVSRKQLGPRETVEFRQDVVGAEHPWRFWAASMSDGTLRVLGILVAVSQLFDRRDPIRLVGIEEPETALHPAAASDLLSALSEATTETQILVTSHSADLIDQDDFDPRCLLIVRSIEGETKVAQVDEASKSAIRDHLYTAGELHRMDQLEADKDDLDRQQQTTLFDMDEDGA